MKRILLATTSLVAASLAASSAGAAEKIKIGVGGYYQAVFAVSDEDADTNPVNIVQEGEIHFEGETTLDNGLTVGVNVQLEGITDGDQIDEHYVYLEGGWGLLQVGAVDGAAYKMAYGAPTAIAGYGVTSPNFQHITGVGAGNTAHALLTGGDANKISYFTPRFSGFQFGVSYAPDADPALTGGYQSSYGFPADDGSNEEVVSAAVNYVAEYESGFAVNASAGLEYTAVALGAADDLFEWQLGGQLGFGGFTLGGGYVDKEDGAWSGVVGATYSTGPWTVGTGYGYFEDSTDNAFHRAEAGGTYALGPGVGVGAGVYYYNDDDATGSDSIAGSIVLDVSF